VNHCLNRLTLAIISTFIDDCLEFAFALVNWARPAINEGTTQAIKAYFAKMALVDMKCLEAGATAMGGFALKLAWTPINAVAVSVLLALNIPVDKGHHRLPSVKLRWLGAQAMRQRHDDRLWQFDFAFQPQSGS
jgi:hypothetical protein